MMEKIQSLSELDEAIKLLQLKKAEDEKSLKELFYQTYESVRPLNMVNNLLKEIIAFPNIKDNLLSTSIGLGVGYLSKLLFQKIAKVPFKNFIGNALMLSVENLIAKNPGIINALSSFILEVFSKKSNKNADEEAVDKDDIHRDVNKNPENFETIY